MPSHTKNYTETLDTNQEKSQILQSDVTFSEQYQNPKLLIVHMLILYL